MLRPARAFLEVEDYSLRPLTPGTLSQCYSILLRNDNRLIIGNSSLSENDFQSFYESTKIDLWPLSMQCLYQDQPLGFILNTRSDVQSLNTRILGIFLEPQRCALCMLMFIRQLFWSFPLQRLYTQLPMTPDDQYLSLYLSIGFQQEGMYRQHQIIGGHLSDVVILGLLRHEFESWCGSNDPRFAL